MTDCKSDENSDNTVIQFQRVNNWVNCSYNTRVIIIINIIRWRHDGRQHDYNIMNYGIVLNTKLRFYAKGHIKV